MAEGDQSLYMVGSQNPSTGWLVRPCIEGQLGAGCQELRLCGGRAILARSPLPGARAAEARVSSR